PMFCIKLEIIATVEEMITMMRVSLVPATVMILGAGLNKTGVMNLVASQIIKVAGTSETRIMVIISSTVAIISSFMQNIGAAALFLPATMRIGRQLNIPPGKILMPMGFCAITGGCLTLVGSSPLIMLNDLMQSWWANNPDAVGGADFNPLGLLSVTPIGLALLIGILAYFAIFGRKLLPADACLLDEDCMDKRLQEIYGDQIGTGYELVVPSYFPAQTLGELELRPKYNVTVVGIAKGEERYTKNFAPGREDAIEPGDILWIVGSDEKVQALTEELHWQLRPEPVLFANDNSLEESGIIEGVVIPHSNLTGHTLQELKFGELYKVNALALVRGDQIIMENINITKLVQGDTLLLQGKWNRFKLIAETMDIAFIEEIRGEEFKPERTKCALFFLFMSLSLVLGFEVKLSIALLTGALGMIITRIISADRAYEAVDWRTVFLLAGLIPLGTAFENTGAAAYIAHKVLSSFSEMTPLLLLFLVSLLSAFFSLVASNVGAAVLMVPLAMNMAAQMGIDPILAALVVAVSASNTFILPTHQVNALIMRPGGYRPRDYMKAGVGASIIYTVILLAMLKMFWGV
ncbi:MAG: SLC13 family permease, partial [Desulfofustis sp.]